MGRFLRLLFCCLLLGAILGSGTAHAVPEVTAVRIGDQAAGTRVVLDLSEPVTYRLFTLENPHRVVLDLPELAWSASDAAVGPGGGPGVVMGLRHGLFRPGTSRIVFDLAQTARVQQAFLLPPNPEHGHRLVVDLEPLAPATLTHGRKPVQVASLAPAAPIVRRPAKRVVVVAAGHGGLDPGAVGQRGTSDKRVTPPAATPLHIGKPADGE